MSHPLVSIIIPVKPGGRVKALECIKWLDYPEDRMEVLVAEGTQPSRQRNEAVSRAKGEILYFLDDDSCPVPDALKRISVHLENECVAVVGGPSTTPERDSLMQKAFGAALGSIFGGFSIRNRYRRTGVVRDCSENELILCNLAFRKRVFSETGGLNEALYPNEENELMDRLHKKGYRLIHDPDIYVLRSQRRTIGAFARQMLNYGRGRAEQSMMAPSSFSPAHIVPTLFFIYIISLLFAGNLLYLLPAACYLFLNMIFSAMASVCHREGRFLAILPPVFFLMHLGYGAGFLWGISRRLTGFDRRPSGEVVIREISRLASTS